MTVLIKAREAGFTLIEMMISLALFALISLAGIALVESVARVEQGTTGRLDRLGQIQRTMFIISRDLEQISAGSLRQSEAGVQFERQGASVYEAPRPIGYELRGTGLVRRAGADQLLIDGLSAVRWSFFYPGRGWEGVLPPAGPQRPIEPTGIAVEMQLNEGAGPSDSLRRVVELPAGLPAAPLPLGLPAPDPAAVLGENAR